MYDTLRKYLTSQIYIVREAYILADDQRGRATASPPLESPIGKVLRRKRRGKPNNLYILLFLLFISACATVPGPPDEKDPFESYNRAMFAFNDVFDENLLRPVAEIYHDNMPNFIQTGISNLFSNLDDILVFFNDLLQFKFKQAASDLTRFVSNSIFGVFGLIDVGGKPDHAAELSHLPGWLGWA